MAPNYNHMINKLVAALLVIAIVMLAAITCHDTNNMPQALKEGLC